MAEHVHPVLAHDIVAPGLGALDEGGDQLVRGEPAVQGGDQRLDDRDGATGRASVAPALQSVRRREMPLAQDRRFVEVQTVVDPQGHALEGLGEAEVGGSGVDRVRAHDDEHLDTTSVHVVDELPKRSVRRHVGGLGVDDGRAHRTQRLVDRMGDRVNCRGLRLPRENDRARAGALEVLHEGGHPRVIDTALDTQAEPRRHRPGEPLDGGAAQREPVVGGRARQRGRALDDVEPVHLRLLRVDLASRGILAHEPEAGGMARHEVGLEAQDDVGGLEPVLGLHRLAERQSRACADVVAVDGLPAHPPRLGQLGSERLPLRGEGRRGHPPGENPKPGTARLALRLERLPQGLSEGAPGALLPQIAHGRRPVGVVQAEDVRLSEDIGRAEALRVVGVPLDLRRPALVALHEDAARVAVVRGRRGEEERTARHQVLGLPHVRENRLLRLLRADGEPGQGQRCAHECQELPPALRVFEGRRLLRKLTLQELEEPGALGELVEALPVATAGGSAGTATHALESDRDGGDVILAHRWHVEQDTCGSAPYSSTRRCPSSSWSGGVS